jgi:hypothetical protein
LSGAAAMILQVLLLMPIRTIMNYQYRHGTSTTVATKTLYADGGISRYYQGMGAALVQGPIARFGDTAANAGILALLQSNGFLKQLPSPVQTIFASACAAHYKLRDLVAGRSSGNVSRLTALAVSGGVRSPPRQRPLLDITLGLPYTTFFPRPSQIQRDSRLGGGCYVLLSLAFAHRSFRTPYPTRCAS